MNVIDKYKILQQVAQETALATSSPIGLVLMLNADELGQPILLLGGWVPTTAAALRLLKMAVASIEAGECSLSLRTPGD